MSFFSSILEKLGLSKPAAPATPAPAAPAAAPKPAAPAPVKPAAPAAPKPVAVSKDERDDADSIKTAKAAAAAAPQVVAISEVDVVAKLEKMASGSGLNWKVSIVDLLKVLGIDSSREARNELAKELKCPEDLMKDSAKMNVWLHKEVLRQIAQNGGNIPKELLD
jgi:hypothetical protein